MRYTVLTMVSYYSDDPQVAVMHQEIQQCASKGMEQEDCEIVNIDVDNAGFKY